MREQYYTIEKNQESKPIYWVYDETGPQLVRQMAQHPHLQGDDGTTPPYYLDQTTFWDMAFVKRVAQKGQLGILSSFFSEET